MKPGTVTHGHTSMPAGKTCKNCGHDSSEHVQFIGVLDDKSAHPCWHGVAKLDECDCPGFAE